MARKVSDSFAAYVAAQADGFCDLSEGCVYDRGLGLGFHGSATPSSYGGSATFTAHTGFLHVRLADPVVAHSDAGLQLSVEVSPGERLGICDLSPPDAEAKQVTTTLTAAGRQLFGDVYPVGHPMAPIWIDDDGIA